MKTLTKRARLSCLATLLLLAAGAADAQSIYKCSKGGQVEYTDRPCVGGGGQLLHQADDTEVIDQYLDLGQDAAAKQYADARNLDALYLQRVEARQQKLAARAQQQADETAAQRQSDAEAQQQAALNAAANHGRLQGENDALRQQNADYRDQLSQPVQNNSGGYYNAGPGYWNGGGEHEHEHDHDHDHGQPPAPPVFHPCTPVAGGTVKC